MFMFIMGWLMGYAPCLVMLGPRLMKPIPEASVVTMARGKGDRWSHGSNIKPFSWKEWAHIPFLISLAKEGPMATLSPGGGEIEIEMCPERGKLAYIQPNVYHICIIFFLMTKGWRKNQMRKLVLRPLW